MITLRTAAQQALEALEEYQSKGAPFLACDGAVAALRAALAQQKDPTDPGHDVDVLREHVRHLERRIRELHAQQAEPLNLRDPAVQKRLASQWGYVPAAAQAEPVEPVAWRWGYRSVTTGEMDWRGYVEIAAHPNLRSPEIIIEPLYTRIAPPQRKPLTEEEIKTAFHAARNAKLGASQDNSRHRLSVIEIARAVEKASWEKNHGQA